MGKKAIAAYPNWKHIRAAEEWDNDIVKRYGIYGTPTMIYLDADKKVLGKAKTLSELVEMGAL